MLFSSWAFILLFLPALILAWQTVAQARRGALPLLLLVFSLLFYFFWSAPFLLLLLACAAVNYGIGAAIASEPPGSGRRRHLLCLGIGLSILPLLWFKYSAFCIANIALPLGADWAFAPPGLPPGISFYTFIQIAWLAGLYKGDFALPTFARHTLFCACFPYVLSGPIVRYDQIGWQFDGLAAANAAGMARGLTLFSIGLAKKTILADSVGYYADAVFGAAQKGWPLSGGEAWLGSLAYTFQLYFDFSGYTDMALGIGLMLGLRLPENFNSPYRATGIVDFWRRWHITLSAWLRDFLYIPMGGNRKGKARQYCNLFLTMLIGGAWHGAGWTFIIWGALHGLMLCINHFFRASIRSTWLESFLRRALPRLCCILFTFLCVNFCWVVFRAPGLDAACAIYAAMLSGPFTPEAARPGIFSALLPNNYFNSWLPLALLAICAMICWLCPTSQRILNGEAPFPAWRPSSGWATATALLTFASLAMLTRQSSFLYFQF